jgi:DNA-binding protein H-NS
MPSYSEIVQQISDLQKQADRQRKEEYASVLKTIKKQISEYGITPEELGFSAAVAGGKRGRKPNLKAGKVRKPRLPRDAALNHCLFRLRHRHPLEPRSWSL